MNLIKDLYSILYLIQNELKITIILIKNIYHVLQQ